MDLGAPPGGMRGVNFVVAVGHLVLVGEGRKRVAVGVGSGNFTGKLEISPSTLKYFAATQA